MLVNIALWAIAGAVRRLRERRARVTGTRSSTACSRVIGQKLEGLPAWPLFETLVGLLLVLGSIYYLIAVRGPSGRRSRPMR